MSPPSPPNPAGPFPACTVRETSTLKLSNRRQRINQYQRVVRVGKGKHGEVYLCRDELANCDVAVKIVRRTNPRDKIKLLRKSHQQQPWPPPLSSTEQSIRKEISIMKRCCHANQVRLLEVIDDPQHDKIYLVMEHLSGGPVQWTNEDHEPTLTLMQTRRVIRDVIVGLGFLHHQGIIHRDIKPANILWTHDRSSIKIIDYGVSHYDPRWDKRKRHEQDSNEDNTLFPEPDLLKRAGTPAFLAPEVVWVPDYANGDPIASSDTLAVGGTPQSTPSTDKVSSTAKKPAVTPAIDIWSLGVTFYCFIFGRTPFNVPESAQDNIHHSEYMLYHQICVQEWEAAETMGVDRVETGGRKPRDKTTEGHTVMQILDQLLQKNPRLRMSLGDFKRHPWILQDVAQPALWLHDTNPEQPSGSRWSKTILQVFRRLFPCSK